MKLDQLRTILDDPAQAEPWLLACGVDETARGHANLLNMATAGVPLDLLAFMATRLADYLPGCSDPGRVLNNVDRFIGGARSPLALCSLFERDPESLPILLQIFSASQHLSDLLIADPQAYDLLRITEGQPVSREMLAAEITAEVDALSDEQAVMLALRRFKRRETLRIGYGDIIRGQPLDVVTKQISFLADAVLEGAVRFARRQGVAQHGEPLRPDGQPARFVVLALGKLGGAELNYSSDIDLIFLFDKEGTAASTRRITNGEFFNRLARLVVRLLTEMTPLGLAYRVDLRLRPEGERGPLVTHWDAALHYYDVLGRTWERQAYVKARPAAGDLALGDEFLQALEPWIYRRYLSLADITGIKALKRRIEHRAEREGGAEWDVKTGRGGIRDVEFAIQFLQLLNGGDLPQLRTGNTLAALARLEEAGCLNSQERPFLEENYRFLRLVEHRLQIMFDLQTHLVPEAPAERRKVAIRSGYVDQPPGQALAAFDQSFKTRKELNRKILDHLLHDAFPDDAEIEPAVDLVLDPDPARQVIAEVLGRYPFRDVELAYRNLQSLATERVQFLSTRRCRHFLASIAPRLLEAIAATPDPDSTLVNLEKVSDSLGGKGVLWELFSFNPPTLRLYVDLCAYSPYLSSILISHPGMIDELMDSLELNKLSSLQDLRQRLAELCRAAEDLDPILHSFKNGEQLRIGVRDILGKEDVAHTTAALAHVAQACLEQIVGAEYEKLADKLGEPTFAEGPRTGEPVELVILALGKFGGEELNYHSDLDIVFLYEADGNTTWRRRSRRVETTTNQHFFSELGQRIIKMTSQLGPYGRLYEVDPRLRPTGRSGSLATPFAELLRYFEEGQGQLWERQTLCRARVVYGAPDAAREAMRSVAQAAFGKSWAHEEAQAIRTMRARLEESASAGDFKRGRGGIVDIEFLVQRLLLEHAGDNPALWQPNTLTTLATLTAAGHLSPADGQFLADSYRFLRTLEGRLRLMDLSAKHALPHDPAERAKLTRVMGFASDEDLSAEFQRCITGNRERFERYCGALAKLPARRTVK